MIKWPERASAALRKLFEPLQDIEVFVEDRDDEVFYRRLFLRAAGDRVKIARVFGLGGKNAVLTAAAGHDFSRSRALFIIDGDLMWLRNEPHPPQTGVHRLEAYCVENLVLCEDAACTVLSQDAAIDRDAAAALLDLSNWKKGIENPLTRLFAIYASAFELDPTLATVSSGVYKLCQTRKEGSKKCTSLDVQLTENAGDVILATLEASHGELLVSNTFSKNISRIQALSDPFLAVSGKDFLLPLWHLRLSEKGGTTSKKSFRIKLADLCNTRNLEELRKALIKAASGGFH